MRSRAAANCAAQGRKPAFRTVMLQRGRPAIGFSLTVQ